MNTGRSGWGGAPYTVRSAAMGYALVTLLAALFACLSTVAHHDRSLLPGAAAADRGTVVPVGYGTGAAATAEDVTSAATGREGCPRAGTCCGPGTHRAATVLSVPVAPAPATAPRLPRIAAPSPPLPAVAHGVDGRTPDLHALQVQRV
ncbi:hypothetical protein [Streptomyces megasporus]|uniref:hypothetical protein n=1 Tax=Streptomyces megasporus TaxID=44060 RepID=UPI0004E282F1|nr:hypothetical protein [Streptomyces megasporus]